MKYEQDHDKVDWLLGSDRAWISALADLSRVGRNILLFISPSKDLNSLQLSGLAGKQ